MMCQTSNIVDGRLLVHIHMYEDLKGQLADSQHGFVKGKSTVSVVLKSIEDGCQVDSIYTAFSKAFVKVRHRLMLSHPVVSGWALTFLVESSVTVMGDCVTTGQPFGPLCCE
jgi:hypothetical protein